MNGSINKKEDEEGLVCTVFGTGTRFRDRAGDRRAPSAQRAWQTGTQCPHVLLYISLWTSGIYTGKGDLTCADTK